MVYVEGVDSSSHLFGHLFRAQGLAGDLAEQQRRYGNTVENMYMYADEIVGDYIEALDRDSTLIVLSDHGFQLGVLHDDPTKTRDMRRVSERYHRVEGILYMYGNNVGTRRRLQTPTLVDIAPTVLALAGLTPARDMPGRVLVEAGDIPAPRRTVASYEGANGHSMSTAADPRADPAILEHLKSLGYLDAASPKGDRNLAAIYFESGKYQEAAEAFEALIADNPTDGALRASYGGTLGALGRFDEALEQLARAVELEPLNPEPYHNRALIYERRGDTEAAIAEYRNALRYSSDYAPSAEALYRLTGSATASPSLTDSQRRAAVIAQKASEAAKHGDYKTAMTRLDEAERLAPDFPLIYQYRSNVAFLMGDLPAARAALKRALELEPDNALFKMNLERVERSSAK
jgi:tetratricopeptide (TPR) repeat protein